MLDRPYSKIGMIARWKPLHLGQWAVLRTLCQQADQVLIGIGSSNRYNVRNPFTAQETGHMLRLSLDHFTNYEIIPVPDLDDGPRWRVRVLELFGKLDLLVTDNPYVTALLQNDYRLIRPVELLASEEHVRINGSMVRAMMARGEPWQAWVPAPCVEYIQKNKLDERFRTEFGLETLAMATIVE